MSIVARCYSEVHESGHLSELSKLCVRQFKDSLENIFEERTSSPWTKRKKRSELQEELDHYGIVQFVKRESFAEENEVPPTTDDDKQKKTKTNKKLSLKELFKDPPQVKLNADGWPDQNVYDPSLDKMFWWRNDPVLNQHHEHWHMVMPSGTYKGIAKDREGENFIYMHRFMLARYDVNRWCLGMDLVEPLVDYTTPIPESFYPPPFLSQEGGERRVPFPARPPNQVFRDIVTRVDNTEIILTVDELTDTLNEIEKWIDGKTDLIHPYRLNLTDEEATKVGSDIEVVLHNIGHNMLGYIMHPYTINAPPSVLVGARAGTRDPLFWRWHRHLDNIYLKWQFLLGPRNFSDDIPPITFREKDLILAFTDELLKVNKTGLNDTWVKYANETFGGENFDKDVSNLPVVTKTLETKMKIRDYVWLEDGLDKERIQYLYPRDWIWFMRVQNNSPMPATVTFRIFICPIELVDSTVHWIEIDKFKRTIGPNEKTVVSQKCDEAVAIRKPAQKTTEQMDDTTLPTSKRLQLDKLNFAEVAEEIFCDCGWPYNLIIPRGSKLGSKFKLFVYASDGTNDLVRTDTQCGSVLLCGGQKWTDKIPDIKPLGYPFDRPFKEGSFYKNFEGMHNVAMTDITIKWVEDFPEV
ncbi:18324_t:CDS:2 [Funneliformis geosporum]|uniref:2335_t:CDS:1 n=1 Tax=Funneliformis geosporum TaxID=1117311 RepID=A0A9W4WT12_9GLOM|nr:2335_t:CDS:2 [Funneliformis geosporum]CAI2184515.1 18324_t:CDS:2 [Funneliformis geosporum]